MTLSFGNTVGTVAYTPFHLALLPDPWPSFSKTTPGHRGNWPSGLGQPPDGNRLTRIGLFRSKTQPRGSNSSAKPGQVPRRTGRNRDFSRPGKRPRFWSGNGKSTPRKEIKCN